jgi:hypothetical protein
MSVAPANTASVLVAISGVLQDPTTYSVTGTTLTFSAAPPSGTANISARYLGIPASGVTTTAYRTITEFTATAGQTTFTPPSYTVGFIEVYRNGVLLGSADYTATNGTTVVLTTGATAGDLVTTLSFYVSSVLNAIPATAGSVGSTYLAGGAVLQSNLGTNVVGNGPAFSAYQTAATSLATGVFTKVLFDTKEFDTNTAFVSSTFQPTIAGYYQINAYVGTGTNSNMMICSIFKNGSEFKRGTTAVSNSMYNSSCCCVIYLNGSTDYIDIRGYQNSGSAQNTSTGLTGSFVSGAMVRAA